MSHKCRGFTYGSQNWIPIDLSNVRLKAPAKFVQCNARHEITIYGYVHRCLPLSPSISPIGKVFVRLVVGARSCDKNPRIPTLALVELERMFVAI